MESSRKRYESHPVRWKDELAGELHGGLDGKVPDGLLIERNACGEEVAIRRSAHFGAPPSHPSTEDQEED